MKTISLEKALKGAAPGSLESDSFATIWSPSDYGGDGHVANCSHGAIDPECRAMTHEKITSALLAHCFNHFPEVVQRLRWYMEQEEELMHYGPMVQNETQRVLTRAETVNLPE